MRSFNAQIGKTFLANFAVMTTIITTVSLPLISFFE
jgi:hypothetical protein